MSDLRRLAIKIILKRSYSQNSEKGKVLNSVTQRFGEKVFTRDVMRSFLSKQVMKALEEWEQGKPISQELADEVANAMKQWAISQGATHYTHWFHPLTGLTAEKHDSFFSVKNGQLISDFSGKELIQQEPDASSLPSGGLRSTFEARGYTAWDPTSPAFIYGDTLCIPSVYVSYNGEALDYKTPLLRSIEAVNKAATKVAKLFDEKIKNVKPTLGAEQEFFLIDEAFFKVRPDLVLTGRTLIGASPARGQQLEDHYFGSIPERVKKFLAEVEIEAYKLGIPLKTRHNEVAPSQYEVAPEFEELNVAVDHNQLLMDLMEKVAKKHKFAILFHEKPFAGINGSGKHNNWSLITDTGVNLFSPGNTEEENLRFLTFLSATLLAIYEYKDLLRASISSVRNDLRLGGNEAPPSIISVFLGSEITKVLETIENENIQEKIADKQIMELNIPKIPNFLFKDNTDRNRTSPFAFTGNKFEFRAVGASANNASAMSVLNAIVAEKLNEFYDELKRRTEQGEAQNIALFKTIRNFIIRSKDIRFEGDNYSEEWFEEAKKRGFKIVNNTPEALDAYLDEKVLQMFTSQNILTETEVKARWYIQMERYVKTLRIETELLEKLITTHVLPASIKYKKDLAETMRLMQEIDMPNSKYEFDMLNEISTIIRSIIRRLETLQEEKKQVEKETDIRKKAIYYATNIRELLQEIREYADNLETKISDEYWHLPKYREMLFIK